MVGEVCGIAGSGIVKCRGCFIERGLDGKTGGGTLDWGDKREE
jgi:hypothetical protein